MLSTTAPARSWCALTPQPHACTAAHCTQGNTDESELTALGRAQALRARAALSDIPFDSCFSSPHTRARQSTEIVWPLLWQQQQEEEEGTDAEGPIYLPSLAEVDLGWFQGLRNGEQERRRWRRGRLCRSSVPIAAAPLLCGDEQTVLHCLAAPTTADIARDHPDLYSSHQPLLTLLRCALPALSVLCCARCCPTTADIACDHPGPYCLHQPLLTLCVVRCLCCRYCAPPPPHYQQPTSRATTLTCTACGVRSLSGSAWTGATLCWTRSGRQGARGQVRACVNSRIGGLCLSV